MYAGDNDDWLPPNPENGHTNAWVRGSMRKPREATNSAFLSDPQTAKLQPYIKKGVGVYKCPADKSTALIDGVKHPRVRTFSMNQAAGTEPTGPVTAVNGRWLDGTRTHRPNRPYRTYGRFSDMVKPSPAGLWMFIDEDETLINDGAFAVSMLLDPTAIIDWPGTYHNFSAGFAFAELRAGFSERGNVSITRMLARN